MNYRISPNNPVRRRLFDAEEPEEALMDNFDNVLQEQALRVKAESMRKWNFDFENERPLEGDFEWRECSEGDVAYVGTARTQPASHTVEERDTVKDEAEMQVEVNDSDEEYENVNLLQRMNEKTPGKNGKNETEDVPLLNEKEDNTKTVNINNEKTGRRNLQFE